MNRPNKRPRKRKRKRKRKPVVIYTDGSCDNTTGIGGWAFAYLHNGEAITGSGGEKDTTSNRMEITAVIQALRHFETPQKLVIYSDSRYTMDGCRSWLRNWIKNNWRTSAKKPVKNRDLWEQIRELKRFHEEIDFRWVKGHVGVELNELCDQLAGEQRLIITRRDNEEDSVQCDPDGPATPGPVYYP